MDNERGNLSDPQFQDKMRDAGRRRERQREDDLKSLMRHDWGRRVVYWVVYDLGRSMSVSFDPRIKGDSSLHTHFADGRRDLAIDVYNEIQRLAPRELLAMMAEQISAAQADLALEVEEKPKA